MANSAAICTSFKVEMLNGHHAFGTSVSRGSTAADSFKMALYFATASIGAGTTAYSSTGEGTGTGYTAGGSAVTYGTAPTSSGTTAYVTPSANVQWTGFTMAAFDGVLLYNTTQSNKAVQTFNIGSQSVTAGTFTLTMPTNDSSNALTRIA